MPFRGHVRIELLNASARPQHFFYQIDYTLEPSLPDAAGYLHATFRRENPTVMRRDFVVAETRTHAQDVVVLDGMVALSDIRQLITPERPDLLFPPFTPRFPERRDATWKTKLSSNSC